MMSNTIQDYKIISELGSGSYGSAFLVHCEGRNEKCVLKKIKVIHLEERERELAQKEVKVLSSLSHNHITEFNHSFEFEGNIYIDMEYCSGGDLQKLIDSRSGILFPEARVLDWFVQLCLAVKFIHDKHIIHRDIKAQNVFLTFDGKIKLGDFGISKILEHTSDLTNTCIGTPYYLSPEMCANKPYSTKSDVWSVGCILYEMVSLKHAFQGNNIKELVIKIVQCKYKPVPPRYSRELKKLIEIILQKDPILRPSMIVILKNPCIVKRLPRFISEQDSVDFKNVSRKVTPKLSQIIKRRSMHSRIGVTTPNSKYCSPSTPIANKRRLKENPNHLGLIRNVAKSEDKYLLHPSNKRMTWKDLGSLANRDNLSSKDSNLPFKIKKSTPFKVAYTPCNGSERRVRCTRQSVGNCPPHHRPNPLRGSSSAKLNLMINNDYIQKDISQNDNISTSEHLSLANIFGSRKQYLSNKISSDTEFEYCHNSERQFNLNCILNNVKNGKYSAHSADSVPYSVNNYDKNLFSSIYGSEPDLENEVDKFACKKHLRFSQSAISDSGIDESYVVLGCGMACLNDIDHGRFGALMKTRRKSVKFRSPLAISPKSETMLSLSPNVRCKWNPLATPFLKHLPLETTASQMDKTSSSDCVQIFCKKRMWEIYDPSLLQTPSQLSKRISSFSNNGDLKITCNFSPIKNNASCLAKTFTIKTSSLSTCSISDSSTEHSLVIRDNVNRDLNKIDSGTFIKTSFKDILQESNKFLNVTFISKESADITKVCNKSESLASLCEFNAPLSSTLAREVPCYNEDSLNCDLLNQEVNGCLKFSSTYNRSDSVSHHSINCCDNISTSTRISDGNCKGNMSDLDVDQMDLSLPMQQKKRGLSSLLRNFPQKSDLKFYDELLNSTTLSSTKEEADILNIDIEPILNLSSSDNDHCSDECTDPVLLKNVEEQSQLNTKIFDFEINVQELPSNGNMEENVNNLSNGLLIDTVSSNSLPDFGINFQKTFITPHSHNISKISIGTNSINVRELASNFVKDVFREASNKLHKQTRFSINSTCDTLSRNMCLDISTDKEGLLSKLNLFSNDVSESLPESINDETERIISSAIFNSSEVNDGDLEHSTLNQICPIDVWKESDSLNQCNWSFISDDTNSDESFSYKGSDDLLIADGCCSKNMWYKDFVTDISDTPDGDIYGWIEGERAIFEATLGLDRFLKAYRYLECAYQTSQNQTEEALFKVENMLDLKHKMLAHSILRLIATESVHLT